MISLQCSPHLTEHRLDSQTTAMPRGREAWLLLLASLSGLRLLLVLGTRVLGCLSGSHRGKIALTHARPPPTVPGPRPPPSSSLELLAPKPGAKWGQRKQLNYDQGQGGNL